MGAMKRLVMEEAERRYPEDLDKQQEFMSDVVHGKIEISPIINRSKSCLEAFHNKTEQDNSKCQGL